MRSAAVIVSAGKGLRLAGERKKQFLCLSGKPILCHTLDPFEACSCIDGIYLVVGPEDIDYTLKEIVEPFGYRKISQIIPGGTVRQESVRKGLGVLSRDVEIVVIHDGVRPFVTPEMITASVEAAKQFKAAIFAVPLKDTVKLVEDQIVLKTLDRESLWQVQTPQAFEVGLLRQAFRKAAEDKFIGTDDASLVERLGRKVHILAGSYMNIKITTPEDLRLAQGILQMKLAQIK